MPDAFDVFNKIKSLSEAAGFLNDTPKETDLRLELLAIISEIAEKKADELSGGKQ